MTTDDDKIEITKKELEDLIREEIRHVYRFNPEVVEFINNLRKQDIDDWRHTIEYAKKVEQGRQIMKWIFYTVTAMVVGIATFGESIIKLKGWFLK